MTTAYTHSYESFIYYADIKRLDLCPDAQQKYEYSRDQICTRHVIVGYLCTLVPSSANKNRYLSGPNVFLTIQ